MSGTSCDGVSAAAARFAERGGGRLDVELLGFVQVPYAPSQRERLLAAMQGAAPREYCRLHADLGGWLADAAAALLAEAGVARADVAAVASHGQTIWHEPGHSTWQLGDAAVLAERLGVPVVHDFRARDVAAGGQGAPLVPAADALLFGDDGGWRLLQNLGGIGNVTVVPPAGAAAPTRSPGVRAFDTGPGMALIDLLARRADPALPFDVDGRLARPESRRRGGRPPARRAVLRREPPKSTGRELFGATTPTASPRCAATHAPAPPTPTAWRPPVALTARSVADAYARFVAEPAAEVLVSGGGARHPVMFEALERALAALPRPVVARRFDDVFFDGEAKEAVAFALLGYLHLHGRPGNVPGATGARGPRVLGARTPA
jgi:anhydro-N-acetylmuramic acid kinase